MSKSLNARAFREALGGFATGVTIITTRDEAGDPIGVTASSFNSVSLDPPLVLWSLAKDSRSLPAFRAKGEFAVHVLANGQEHLADTFARSGEDKFKGQEWHESATGVPLFELFVARFECRTAHEYDGGDHVILVGEVTEFEAQDLPPLIYQGGAYGQYRRLETKAEDLGEPPLTGPNS
ncbi:flavin reductase family protein [Altererythrobacter lutimaris]|uniref:Flavin reductase family protein n=1 Tax=Altererythrobacter lutimaris TaxID=2743979 RepID=A0A850H6V9_9SPHN|nr:flavin reductase family protein [Altererythrobacter lutimaris]NVE94994.1 flavin reductase family protein [Altererythrobacter lutimaris]